MLGPGFTVDPDELNGIAARVLSVVDTAGGTDLGSAIGGAEVFGHGGLHTAVTTLATTVQSAVHALRGSAGSLATGVRAAAANYVDRDRAVRHALNQVGGN